VDFTQATEDRFFKALNIEQQNKEPQNDEVVTSIFEIPCSISCGSKRRYLRRNQSCLRFSWILTTCPERLDLRTSSEPQSNSSSTGPVEGLTPIYWHLRIDLTKRRNGIRNKVHFFTVNRKRDWTTRLVVVAYFLLPGRATRLEGLVRYD
jgi:hypothetical protein